MRFKKLIAAAAATLMCATMAPNANAIIGGRTNPNAAVARIIMGNQLCTGALISPTEVLTAKHCVFQGRNQIAVGTSTYTVAGATLNPNADLAILKLNRASSVPPAKISANNLKAGDRLLTVGYGGDNHRLIPFSRAEAADATVVRRVTNLQGDDRTAVVIESTIRGGRAMPGDSGGPLLRGNYVTGVLSLSDDPGTAGFWVPVAEHVDWILRHSSASASPKLGAPMPVVDGTAHPPRFPLPQSPIQGISEIESLFNYNFNVQVLSS